MNVTYIIVINTYSVILLAILGLRLYRYGDRRTRQYQFFVSILIVAMLMLIFDAMARLDGFSYPFYPFLNRAGNFFLFLMSPLLPTLWLGYIHAQLHPDQVLPNRYRSISLLIHLLNAFLLLASLTKGWYYWIDANNVFHRGSFYLVSWAINGLFVIMAYGLIAKNRKNVERIVYYSLLFVAVPPIIGMGLQIVLYGTSLILHSMVISCLIVFLNIQNRNFYTDYLTGVYNRKKLEAYLHELRRMAAKEKTFAAILIDLDDFKGINDRFGHSMGDQALEETAKLLKSALRTHDFIARYGGDEFCIVLHISDEMELEKVVNRIQRKTKQHNDKSDAPYRIKFSMGYAVYDAKSRMSVEAFQAHIDKLMYENKRANRAG